MTRARFIIRKPGEEKGNEIAQNWVDNGHMSPGHRTGKASDGTWAWFIVTGSRSARRGGKTPRRKMGEMDTCLSFDEAARVHIRIIAKRWEEMQQALLL